MASIEIETRFVGQFLRSADEGLPDAWRAVEVVRPAMLEDRELERWYAILADRFAAGKDVFGPTDETPTDAAWSDIAMAATEIYPQGITPLAEAIRTNWRARRQVELLRAAALDADIAVESKNGAARKVAERVSMQLLDLFAAGDDTERPRDFREILDVEREQMDREEDVGIPFPYPILERAEAGPVIPGEIVGISGFSNSGKSALIANMALGWLRRGYPVIAFPTEMRAQWVARMLAAHSGVRQTIAEKRQWRKATDEERDAYRAAIEEAGTWPLEVVNRPNITPGEIVAATRVIRRRWKGRPVIVAVDHMHRLDYGGEPANEAVGPATKLLKNFAGDEGLCLLLLFQPRKPDAKSNTYQPIAGYQIRGDSTVWNELDVHLSPFRAWVKTDVEQRTEWDTPKAITGAGGKPVMARPPKAGKESDGVKLSDEHVFLKIDKRRVGGEGPTVWLSYHQPSGRIYELDGRYAGEN